MAQVARRTATGVVACWSVSDCPQGSVSLAYLEHLDKGDAEVEVCQVTADERQGEHEANGDNGAQVDPAGHGDLFPRVEHGGEAGHELGHEGGEAEMPCCEDDCWGVSVVLDSVNGVASVIRKSVAGQQGSRLWDRRKLTKVGGVEDVLVEDDDGRGEGDPGAVWCQSVAVCGEHGYSHAMKKAGCSDDCCCWACSFSTAGLTVGRTGTLSGRSVSPDWRSFSMAGEMAEGGWRWCRGLGKEEERRMSAGAGRRKKWCGLRSWEDRVAT